VICTTAKTDEVRNEGDRHRSPPQVKSTDADRQRLGTRETRSAWRPGSASGGKSGGNTAFLRDYSFWRKAAFRVLTLNYPPLLTYFRGRKETTNMGKNRIIGTWVGICAFIAVMLGGLEHAARTNPNSVDTAQIAVRGVVIPPFN
jgi:hypothetical protein